MPGGSGRDTADPGNGGVFTNGDRRHPTGCHYACRFLGSGHSSKDACTTGANATRGTAAQRMPFSPANYSLHDRGGKVTTGRATGRAIAAGEAGGNIK